MIFHLKSYSIALICSEEGVGALSWWRRTYGEAFLGICLIKLQLTFLKLFHNKKLLLFFDPLWWQLAKCLSIPRKLLPWPLLLMDLLLLLLDHFHFLETITLIVLYLQDHTGNTRYYFKKCFGILIPLV